MLTVSWPMFCLPGSLPLSLKALASPALQPTQVRSVSLAALLCFDSSYPILAPSYAPNLSMNHRISEEGRSMVQEETFSLLILAPGSPCLGSSLTTSIDADYWVGYGHE